MPPPAVSRPTTSDDTPMLDYLDSEAVALGTQLGVNEPGE